MRDDDGNRPTWRFFDGAVSVSISMLLAVLLAGCEGVLWPAVIGLSYIADGAG